MRLHYAFGLVTMLLLLGETSTACPDHIQTSNQIAFRSSVQRLYSYQPPRAGVPGRREGAGTR
jgi:hypothetical protein